MEEVGKLFHWDTNPVDEHKKQSKKQLRPCQVTVPASIHMGQAWGQTSLGQHITGTGTSENQGRGQEEPDQDTTLAGSHKDWNRNQAGLG